MNSEKPDSGRQVDAVVRRKWQILQYSCYYAIPISWWANKFQYEHAWIIPFIIAIPIAIYSRNKLGW